MKQLPYSPEAEITVISSLFCNPKIITKIADILEPNHFYDYKNKLIYELLITLAAKDRPITEDLLIEEITKNGWPIPASYIYTFSLNGVSEENIHKWISIVKENSERRLLINKTQLLQETLSKGDDYESIMDAFEKTMSSIKLNKKESKTIDVLMKDAWQELEKNWKGEGLIKTGFEQLDLKTGGFLPGQLNIIAARTSMGKTSFALSLAHNVMKLGRRIGFISLEMPSKTLAIKSLSIESRTPFNMIRDGDILNNLEALGRVLLAEQAISQWPYELEDSVRSLQEIKSWIRQMVHDKGIKIVFIDYLGLIQAPRARDRHLEIGDITRSLKELAIELSIPIILLAQVNREVEGSGDHRPMLKNLKDSGDIEQDADIVMFLYREYYYDKENGNPNHAELIIAKNRLGELGTVNLYYEPRLMYFCNSDEEL